MVLYLGCHNLRLIVISHCLEWLMWPGILNLFFQVLISDVFSNRPQVLNLWLLQLLVWLLLVKLLPLLQSMALHLLIKLKAGSNVYFSPNHVSWNGI